MQQNTGSSATDVLPLVDVDAVLLYKRDLSCRYCTTPLPVAMQLPKLKVDPTNTSKPRRRCSFFNSGHCCCRSVRGTGTAQLLDFNIVVTLISFILSEKWLESRARQSIGDAIASLLALQAPTALLVEEDAVLVEQEVAVKLLLECIASYLVC